LFIALQLWSLPSRKFLCSLVGHSNWVRTAALCPTNGAGSGVVGTGSDDKLVKLWDIETHQCLHTFHDHTKYVHVTK
jgi:centriolar protein POC1